VQNKCMGLNKHSPSLKREFGNFTLLRKHVVCRSFTEPNKSFMA
jgi:hypothetical protein